MNSSSCSSPQLNRDHLLSMDLAETDGLLSLRQKQIQDPKRDLTNYLVSNQKAGFLQSQNHRKAQHLFDLMSGSQSSITEALQQQKRNLGLLNASFYPTNTGEVDDLGSLQYLKNTLHMAEGYIHQTPIWNMLGGVPQYSDSLADYSSLIGLLNLRQQQQQQQQQQQINMDIQNRQDVLSRTSSFMTKIESQHNIPEQINIFNQSNQEFNFKQSLPKQTASLIGHQPNSSTGYRSLSQPGYQNQPIELIINGIKREPTFSHSPYTELTRLLQNSNVLNEFTDILANRTAVSSPSRVIPNEAHFYRRMLYQKVLEAESMKKEENMNENESNCDKIIETIENIRKLGLPKPIRSSQVLLESIAIEAPKKEYTVYKDLMKMCEQFIRGEKRKRFKQRNSDSQYMSRFHNLNRLFFYQIVSIYNYQSISCFNLPSTIASQLLHVISQVKIHSKLQPIKHPKESASRKRTFANISKEQTDSSDEKEPHLRKILSSTKNLVKTEDTESFEFSSNNDDQDDDQDFPIKNIQKNYQTLKVEAYTHSHYNVLFLGLTPSSMESLKHSKKDIEAHWLAYKIDLRKPSEIPPEKLEYANLMKGLFYKIFLHFNSVTQSTVTEFRESRLLEVKEEQQREQSDLDLKAIELRLDYYIRVALGIQKLSEGVYSHKF